jgi:hypothetical protein
MSEESQPPGSSAQRSVEIRVLLPNVPLLSPSRYSACGNKVKYVSTQNGSERICLIGGIITVDDVVYGLTAAHILRDELFEDDLFEDDDSTFSELIDQLEVPNAADCPVTIDQQVLPVVSHISGQESFTWQTATVGHMMYAGTTIADLEANSKTKLGGSDFALVSMESSTRLLLQNIYFFSPSQSDGNGSDVCIIDSFAESIEPGKVSIICSPSDVIEGYLLPGDDLFLEGVNVFSTRKIETSRRLGMLSFVVSTYQAVTGRFAQAHLTQKLEHRGRGLFAGPAYSV